ncbi:MAG: hypothetical protein Kow009_01760 [Spirochaetales bacterium]
MNRRANLKREIFKISFLLSSITVLVLTTHFFLFFYPLQIDGARSYLKETNTTLTTFIEGYFREIIHSSRILSRNMDVIEGVQRGKESRERALALFREFQAANENIYYIYAGYTNGLLLINDYEPPPGYSIFHRPWYRAIMDDPYPEKRVVGLLYREAKTNELLLSTICILESPTYGFTGVLAIDSYTKAISDKINPHSDRFKSLYSAILTRDLEIIVHPDQSLIGKHLFDLIETQDEFESGSFLNYRYRGKSKIAYVNHLPLTDWYILTTVEKQELLAPARKSALLYLFVVLLLISIRSLLSSILWSRKLIEPISALERRVKTLVETGEIRCNYPFPYNEIGSIARHIEQLAGDALLAKNRDLESANQKILSINAELEERNREMERLATHDFLTGIYNRRKLEEVLGYEYEKFERYRTPLSVVIFDLDHFKSINDSFGHKAGDNVLQEISHLIKNNLRKTDTFGRWGGEEFLIILSNTPLPRAKEVAEKVRTRVEQTRFSVPRTITISLGLAEAQEEESLERFLQRVDRYLYIAKMKGRNRTIWTSEG